MIYFLYLDDEKFDHLAFKRVIDQFRNVQVDYVVSKKEVFDKLENKRYDVLISDVFLGNEVMNWSFKDIEVFYVSGLDASFKRLDDYSRIKHRCFVKPVAKNNIEDILIHTKSVTPDFSIIEEMSDGDSEFETQLKQIFVEEIPAQLQDAGKALMNKEHLKFASIIHAMQTKIRTFGLSRIEEIAELIENHSRSLEPLNEIQTDWEELQDLLNKTVYRIKRDLEHEVYNY